jgi:hypothetical protein
LKAVAILAGSRRISARFGFSGAFGMAVDNAYPARSWRDAGTAVSGFGFWYSSEDESKSVPGNNVQ